MKNTARKTAYPILWAALFCAVLLGLLCGGAELTVLDSLQGLFAAEGTNAAIMRLVRLPRVMGGAIAGAGLALSGALLQAVCDNALAGPNLIGINSGAGFGAVLVLAFFPSGTAALPLAAFCGAFFAAIIIMYVSKAAGGKKASVILAGVALTALLNGVISFINLIFDDVLVAYNHFSVGGLANVFFSDLIFPALMIGLCLCSLPFLTRPLSLLCLGDECASALGVNVTAVRYAAITCAAASAAAAVSFAGLLGFVGLIVPHAARAITKRNLCPMACALLGATLTVLSDTAGRTLFAPTEVPVGVITALLGAPFFILILLKGRHGYAEN